MPSSKDASREFRGGAGPAVPPPQTPNSPVGRIPGGAAGRAWGAARPRRVPRPAWPALIATIVAPCALVFGSAAQGALIYTCLDANGRYISSDHVIERCADQPQQVLNSQGIVLKVINPQPPQGPLGNLGARRENAALTHGPEKNSLWRGNEELLIRYPTRQAHEQGRSETLLPAMHQLDSARKELALLQRPMPASAEPSLIASRNSAIAVEKQIINNYEGQVKRINARFDAEDARLLPLWQRGTTAASTGAWLQR